MDNLLRYAYVEEHCNACGGSYRVTLYEVLAEQRLANEWQSPRRCSACSSTSTQLTAAFPEQLLQRLSDAWQEVRQVAGEAGVDLRVGS